MQRVSEQGDNIVIKEKRGPYTLDLEFEEVKDGYRVVGKGVRKNRPAVLQRDSFFDMRALMPNDVVQDIESAVGDV